MISIRTHPGLLIQNEAITDAFLSKHPSMTAPVAPPAPPAPPPSAAEANFLAAQSTAQSLIARARQLAIIDQHLRHALEPWLATHLRLGNIRDDTVVLFVDTAAVLTELRFRKAELLELLRTASGMDCLTQVEVRVNPEAFITPTPL
jgi:hypothetical protein